MHGVFYILSRKTSTSSPLGCPQAAETVTACALSLPTFLPPQEPLAASTGRPESEKRPETSGGKRSAVCAAPLPYPRRQRRQRSSARNNAAAAAAGSPPSRPSVSFLRAISNGRRNGCVTRRPCHVGRRCRRGSHAAAATSRPISRPQADRRARQDDAAVPTHSKAAAVQSGRQIRATYVAGCSRRAQAE